MHMLSPSEARETEFLTVRHRSIGLFQRRKHKPALLEEEGRMQEGLLIAEPE